MSDETATAKKTRERFGLEWWGAIPLLGFIGMQIVLSLPFLKDTDVSQLGGRIVGGLLLACLIAWIVYAFAAHSRRAATIAFTIMLVLGSFSAMPDGDARSDESAAQAVEAQITQELTAARQHYERIIGNFTGAGGLDPSTLTTRGAVEERLALLQKVKQANGELTRTAVALPERVDGMLRGRGVSERGISAAMDAFRSQFPLEKVMSMRRSEGAVCDAMRAELTFMSDNFGRWSYDAASRSVSHATDALREQHIALQAKVQEAVEEQQRMTKAAAANIKAGSAGAVAP